MHHLRSEAFLQGASRAARTLSQVGGFTNGASLGYLVGSLVAAGAGASGTATFVTALAGAGGVGVLGWKAMGHASDWAGHKGAQLYKKDPFAGEAVGRATLNLAVDLVSGSRFNTVADLGITAGWGWHKAHQAEKNFLKEK